MDPREELIKRGSGDLAVAISEALYDTVVTLPLPSGNAKFGKLGREWYALRDDRGRINGIRHKEDLPAKKEGQNLKFKPYPYPFLEMGGTLYAETGRKGDLVRVIGPRGRRIFVGKQDVSRQIEKKRSEFLARNNLAESKGWDVQYKGITTDGDPGVSTHAILTKGDYMIFVNYAADSVLYGIKKGSKFRPKGKVNMKGLSKLLATYGR